MASLRHGYKASRAGCLLAALLVAPLALPAEPGAAPGAAPPAPVVAPQSAAAQRPAAADANERGSVEDLRAGAAIDGLAVAGLQDAVQKGDDAWRRGDLDRAVWYYVQALQIDDRDAETLAKIGSIHERKGNDRLARQAFEMALGRNPGDARIAERLGLLCLRTQDYAAAQTWLEHTRGLEPGRPRTAEALASLAARRNDPVRAALLYTEVLAREPESTSALIGRGQARLMLGDDGAAEADLVAARVRLEANGTGAAGAGATESALAAIRRGLGTVYGRTGRYPEALRELLAVLPEHEAWNRLGEMALARSDYRSALRHFSSAIETSPEYYVEARRNLKVAQEFIATRGAQGDAADAPAVRSATSAPFAPRERIATASVRVRAAPDVSSPVKGQLSPDERVIELERRAEWSRVERRAPDGTRLPGGWMHSSFLAAPATAAR